MTMNFREFLNELEDAGKLEHVEEEFSTEYEIASKLRGCEEALLFENVAEHDMKAAGNIFGTRERIARGLGIERDQLINVLKGSLSDLREPGRTSNAPAQEIVDEEFNLMRIPILKHYEKDGGPYMTASILVAEDENGKRNLSFHRMQLIDDDKFTVRLVPRDLHRMFMKAEGEGRSLEVAAFLGVHPGVALAAATSPPYDVDEYGIAANLTKGLELTECHTIDLEVPARAEIVLEGRLLAGERAPEGPFADITGTYDAVRDQPVFKVNCVTKRRDAVYQAILPGGSEHQLLMGMPREPSIFEEVDKVAEAKNVILTPGGCGWLHAFVSINKQEEGDGRRAMEASFRAHPSLKHVVIVDDDVDIYDSEEVEWAIATRFRADRDVVIKSDVEGSSLDPTADPETRLGSKMGMDATKDLDDPERFERAHIPQ